MTIINGYYFSFDFVISIDEQRSCSLFIGTTRLYDLTINKLTDHLRNFTTDHPFHIVRYQRGHYRLLDPDGFDYIGQYVSLKDAKRTCKGNFTYGG
ncbi:hypothetical protein LT679_00460 [Mucilaginibacter roseus]|uniref:Uncharacterized protein n=1 Tax=Mucilaginibacter roseus TaxID=1528868 RepID=A0ABS8TXI1_9SPHI|nr:hypothetical protein [Mucilaginibacter roseus]MCD8739057.1 hypothetical protein [Mucilaginibacter roseus]